MEAPISRLEKLVDLAREPSSDKRRELLREITDVFLAAPDAHSASERGHFDAIMCSAARNVEAAMRKALATRLANVPSAPHGLIKQLAEDDEIDVARPVLQSSPVLTDEDLIEVVKSRGSDHMAAISNRREVSERVVEELVERGNEKVLITLAKNKTAQFSRTAMSVMVQKSEYIPDLQEPLVARPDVPPDMLGAMFFFVSEKLKREIMAQTDELDPGVLEKQIKESWNAIAAEAHSAVAEELTGAERFIREMMRANALHESLLIELLNSHRHTEFMHAFAYLIDVDVMTAQRILDDSSCESLAIACKAARLDRSTYAKIVFTLFKDDPCASGKSLQLIELYDKINIQTAQRVMRFWRVRKQAATQNAGAAA